MLQEEYVAITIVTVFSRRKDSSSLGKRHGCDWQFKCDCHRSLYGATKDLASKSGVHIGDERKTHHHQQQSATDFRNDLSGTLPPIRHQTITKDECPQKKSPNPFNLIHSPTTKTNQLSTHGLESDKMIDHHSTTFSTHVAKDQEFTDLNRDDRCNSLFQDGMNVLQQIENARSCGNSFKEQGLSSVKYEPLRSQTIMMSKNISHLDLAVSIEAYKESDCLGETTMKTFSIAEEMKHTAQSDRDLRPASRHPSLDYLDLAMINQNSASKGDVIRLEQPSVQCLWNGNENPRDKNNMQDSRHHSTSHFDLRTSEIKSMVGNENPSDIPSTKDNFEYNRERIKEGSDHKLSASISKSHEPREKNKNVELADKFSELLSKWHESRARSSSYSQRLSVGWEQNVVTDILFLFR